MEVFATFILLVFFSLSTSTPALAADVPQDEYIPNGSFEQGPKPTDLNNTVIKGKYSLPKWEINGHVEYIHGGSQPDGMFFGILHGDYGVKLGKDASTSQTVPVKPGSFYAITVWALWTCPQDQEVLRVSVLPQFGDLPLQDMDSVFNGDTYAWGFKATSKFARVTFHNPAGIEEDRTCGPLVDAVAIKEIMPPRLTRVNLIKNGGFEEGPLVFKNTWEGVLLPPQYFASPLPGWIVESPKAVRFIDSQHFAVPSGLFAVELVGGRESAITQVIRTVPQRKYTLTFTVGDANNRCVGSLMLEALAANATLKVPFNATGKGAYKTVGMAFIADSPRTNITFYSSFYHQKEYSYREYCGPVVDQVVVLSARRSK